MKLSSFTIVADDLTGALDAAAPLASVGEPFYVSMFDGGNLTKNSPRSVSTETRDKVTAEEAKFRVSKVFADSPMHSMSSTLWFKKIDSMLRGHWAEEVAAASAVRQFSRIIVAPAFPELGRQTVNGSQYALNSCGILEPVGMPIADLLIRAGLSPTLWQRHSPVPHAQTIVVDASTRDDLDYIVAAFAKEPSILWVGSGGLAEAIAGNPANLPAPTPDYFLIGTQHTVTKTQSEFLAKLCEDAVIVNPVFDKPTALEADEALGMCIADLLCASVPSCVFVTGGATLAKLMYQTSAKSLSVQGRIAPGLPLSCINGGVWDQVGIISKSGGFGGQSLMADLALGSGLIANS